MKALRLRALGAAISALAIIAAAGADAQRGPVGTIVHPPHEGSGHAFRGGFYVIERETVIEREVVREVGPAEPAAAAAPPPEPRDPYVIGRSYGSLPGGCMKLIDGGVSYYNCSGDWYRQVGGAQYRAVAQP